MIESNIITMNHICSEPINPIYACNVAARSMLYSGQTG